MKLKKETKKALKRFLILFIVLAMAFTVFAAADKDYTSRIIMLIVLVSLVAIYWIYAIISIRRSNQKEKQKDDEKRD